MNVIICRPARPLLHGAANHPGPVPSGRRIATFFPPGTFTGSQELECGLRQGKGTYAAPYQRPDRPRDRLESPYLAMQSNPDITGRIHELDREWDIERALEANAALLGMTGLAFTVIRRDRRWLVLPGLVLPFLLQHAVQGWCPPLEVLRRLGFRTRKEIDREKYALMVLRGDFADLPSALAGSPAERAEAALRAADAWGA